MKNWLLIHLAMFVSLVCFAQKSPTLNVVATNDSVIINDSIAFSNNDLAKQYLENGIEMASNGDYKGALSEFQTALLFDLNNPEIYYNRGLCYFYLDSLSSSVSDLTTALTISPGDTNCLEQRGIIYAKWEKFDPAMADFNKVIKSYPKSGRAFYNKAITLLEMDKNADACALLHHSQQLGYAGAKSVIAQYCH